MADGCSYPRCPRPLLQTGWCYRRKDNFTFRYDALEDELRVATLPAHTAVQVRGRGGPWALCRKGRPCAPCG